MRADGIYDVDANTSIDQLSEDLNIKMPEVSICFHLILNMRLYLWKLTFLLVKPFCASLMHMPFCRYMV